MTAFRQGLAIAMAVGCATAARGQDEGFKKPDRLRRRAEATVDAVASMKEQLAKTMEYYNALVAIGAESRKGLLRRLQQQMATTDEHRAEILFCAAEMDAEAETLFRSWAATVNASRDPEIRKRGQERLATARLEHAQIGVAGRRAAELYVPVMQGLRQQVSALGQDLDFAAINSQGPERARLAGDMQELVKRIDDTLAAARAAMIALGP
jgi:DUF2959 family protein